MGTFSPAWTTENGDENFTLYVPEVDVFGVGPTKEAAVESLIETIQEYATLYFGDLQFYLSPTVGRNGHLKYLRQIVRCEGDHKQIRAALGL